jgi:diaminopimelate decarboxylase
VGVSFHVGSGCSDSTRYAMALRDFDESTEIEAEGKKEKDTELSHMN